MNTFEIIINDEIETYGLITYNIRKEGNELIKEGMLKTHVYVEELHSLMCARFRLSGIDVYAETTGSNDIFFIYAFTYEELEIANREPEYSLEELFELYKQES